MFHWLSFLQAVPRLASSPMEALENQETGVWQVPTGIRGASGVWGGAG